MMARLTDLLHLKRQEMSFKYTIFLLLQAADCVTDFYERLSKSKQGA